jgi:hypothetical protein
MERIEPVGISLIRLKPLEKGFCWSNQHGLNQFEPFWNRTEQVGIGLNRRKPLEKYFKLVK